MPKQRASKSDYDDILFDAIHGLRNQIGELRDAIDELREEIQWGNRNCSGYVASHIRLDRSDTLEPAPSVLPPLAHEATTEGSEADCGRYQERLW